MLSRMDVPQREHSTGRTELGTGFTLRKMKCGRAFQAVCRLKAHDLGWELVLDVDGPTLHRKVCRTSAEVVEVAES
jgi:hypothetical protein